jgi:hypothetical protein
MTRGGDGPLAGPASIAASFSGDPVSAARTNNTETQAAAHTGDTQTPTAQSSFLGGLKKIASALGIKITYGVGAEYSATLGPVKGKVGASITQSVSISPKGLHFSGSAAVEGTARLGRVAEAKATVASVKADENGVAVNDRDFSLTRGKVETDASKGEFDVGLTASDDGLVLGLDVTVNKQDFEAGLAEVKAAF